MAEGYDRIAPIYDLLGSTVLAGNIKASQEDLLEIVPRNSHLLIAGGGTGWILESLNKRYKAGLQIDYVEISEGMQNLAKNRNYGQNVVLFHTIGVQDYVSERKYDVILTPYFMDNFTLETAKLIFDKLDQLLKPGGLWLFADFHYDPENSPEWHKVLLDIMYWFFSYTCGIKAKELAPITTCFETDYKLLFEKYRFGNFIRSAVYRKSASAVILS